MNLKNAILITIFPITEMTKSKRNKASLHKVLVGEENCDFVIATIVTSAFATLRENVMILFKF